MLDRVKNILKAEFSSQFDHLFGEKDALEDLELEELIRRFTGKSEKSDPQADYKKQQRQWEKNHESSKTYGQVSKEKDYYGYLELPMGAPFEEIKKSYRKLMKVYHPDLYHNDPEKHKMAQEVSQKLNEAYVYFEKKFGKS